MWVLSTYHLKNMRSNCHIFHPNLQIDVIPEKKNKMARRLIEVIFVPRNFKSTLKGLEKFAD